MGQEPSGNPPTNRRTGRRVSRNRNRRRPLVYHLKPGDALEFDHSGKRTRERVIVYLTDGLRVRHRKAKR